MGLENQCSTRRKLSRLIPTGTRECEIFMQTLGFSIEIYGITSDPRDAKRQSKAELASRSNH